MHGAAGQEGSIQEGDLVLSINGTTLQNSGHWEALRTLRKARGRGMAVVVVQKGVTGDSQKKLSDPVKGPPNTDTGETGEGGWELWWFGWPGGEGRLADTAAAKKTATKK